MGAALFLRFQPTYMTRRITYALACLLSMSMAAAQKMQVADTADRYLKLNEVVVSSSKFLEKTKNIVQRIDLISARQIARVNAQNTGDLLINTGNVFVQKSQQGGSSPVIRGFEASRVLLVVDGIRMNNAVYRSGHLQNVITVDQNMLQGMEVMFGPSSTMYGSDALGGSVHMITKPVSLAGEQQTVLVSGSIFGRYSTANAEKTGHADINVGYRKLGFLTSVTFSDFGDLRMGNRYPADYPDFGRRTNYITQVNGSFPDSVVRNVDDRVQKFSGYRQWDIMQKIRYRASDRINHVLNLQFSNSGNIPRYDRLQDIRNGELRWAQWYYGPQKRNLFAYTLEADQLSGFLQSLRFTASYQDIEESRQQREYRRYDRFDSRRERIKVAGFVLDMRKKWDNHELTMGADAQLNDVKSVADRTNLFTGAQSKLDTRYPNGKNRMNAYGLFAQHTYKFRNEHWVSNAGIRLQANSLHSTIEDNSFFNLPVTEMKQHPVALTGNLGAIFSPTEATRISFGLSSGFRAPNIDDLARVFESSTAQRRVVIPNVDIKPEYTYTLDLNMSHLIAGKIKLEAGGYYTLFRNAIALAPFTLNGQDSIIYNGQKAQVVANQNVNRAYLFGFNAGVTAELTEHFSLMSTLNVTYGRYLTNPEDLTAVFEQQPDGSYLLLQKNVSSKPLDHIPPVFGKTSMQYRYKGFQSEVFALYNGWKRLDQYYADGEDNAQYATADGMPSWWTLNLRLSCQVTEGIQIQAAVENILDRNYRYFASGFSAAGRNFVFAARFKF